MLFSQYCRQHKSTVLNIYTSDVSHIMAKMNHYEIDWAVLAHTPSTEDYVSLLLDTDELCLAVSAEHPFARRESVSLEEWDSRFPEGVSPDISGYQERWLFQLEDGRQLLRLDDQLYLLQYHQADGEVFELLRLRPVPLEPERVLELDRLLLSVSGDDSVAAEGGHFRGRGGRYAAAAGLPAAAGRRGGHPAVLLHHAGVPV